MTDGSALRREYDFIIVGAGSGGCAVARRLVERTEATILLIEAGPSDAGIAAIEDAARWTALLGGPFDWNYSYAPTPRVDGRVIAFPRGKVLGGSSSINAMLWNRGHPSDYDRWAADGATGWDFESVLPYFKRTEDWEGGANQWRGAGGPLRIERSRNPHPVAAALLDAARELGQPVIDDHNGPSNEGAALSNLNMRGAARWNAASGYLRPVAGVPNLTILTGSLAVRLGFNGTHCTSVFHLVDGDVRETRAGREVILAAGSIDTPRLLILSGVGDPADLKRLGIAPRVDLPGVGKNLQDHPLVMGVNFVASKPLGPARDNGGGTMINWKSRAGTPAPDMHAFIVQGRHAGPEVIETYRLTGEYFAISPGLMRSKSRGYMRVLETKPGGAVENQPNFLAEPGDLETLADGVEFCLELGATKAFAPLTGGPASPNRGLSRREREEYVRLSCASFFHTCGTCAMGQGAEAVVDPELRVRGIEGLRIADASVIPTIPTCNTHAPVSMIGERAADFILGAAAAKVPAGDTRVPA